MKRILGGLLILMLIIPLSACARADAQYIGKYVGVSGVTEREKISGGNLSNYKIELYKGGKGKIEVFGREDEIKWKNDDKTITLTVLGRDAVGELGQDTFMFKNYLDMGIDLTLAREGSEAANIKNYMTDSEKYAIGTWRSYKVLDIEGKDASSKVKADGMLITFKEDHTASIIYGNESHPKNTWGIKDASGYISGSINTMWTAFDNEIQVDYYVDDEYYVFSLRRQ